MEEKIFLLEPTSTTGRGSAARPRPRPGDACRSIAPRTDVSQIGPNRIAVAGTPWRLRTDVPTDVPTPVMEEKIFLLEPTSTTGRGSAARPRPRPGDACRSIAPRTDVSQIGPNRIAVAGTPWKLRTDVPTDVPTPAMAAGSDGTTGDAPTGFRKNRVNCGSSYDSRTWKRFSTVKIVSPMPARHGNFARTFRRTFRRRPWQQGPTRNGGGSSSLSMYHQIFKSSKSSDQTPAGDRRLRYREGAGTLWYAGDGVRYLEEKIFSSNRPRRPAEARRQDPALARATRAGR